MYKNALIGMEMRFKYINVVNNINGCGYQLLFNGFI